jgi:hypothetical protein
VDRDHLTRLIDDPARVQRDDIADLKAMAERYPWFSGAHLLLAVGGHRDGDVLFDEQLRASAAHLPSRAVLFDRLHAPVRMTPVPMAPSPVQEVVIATEPETRTHEGSVRYAVVEDIPGPVHEEIGEMPVEAVAPTFPEPGLIGMEEIPVEAAAPTLPDPASTLVEETAAEAMAPARPEPPLQEHTHTPWKERMLRGDRDEEELDRQMRDSAVAISYELLLEREGLLETPTAGPHVLEPAPRVVEVIPPVSTTHAPPTSRSFTDWLSEGMTDAPQSATALPQEPATVPPVHRTPTARPVVDPEIIRAVHQLGPVGSKHAPETPETKALIDRFLQQNAQQTAPAKKAEFFNPQTAAKRSLEEHADLVTETLARIYEKQGNIAKAMAAYERLAVKHPEKSAHFRALAKALTGK